MAIKLEQKGEGRILQVSLSDKLAKDDYEAIVPILDQLVKEHGKIRMLVIMHDFHGWTTGGFWEDSKFATRHFDDINRLAIVSKTCWLRGMVIFCKPFSSAMVRFFDPTAVNQALFWLQTA